MERYEVIESKQWVRDDGITASIYGAVPYTSDLDRGRWRIEMCGWTIFDKVTNTVGVGRRPFASREEAEAFIVRIQN